MDKMWHKCEHVYQMTTGYTVTVSLWSPILQTMVGSVLSRQGLGVEPPATPTNVNPQTKTDKETNRSKKRQAYTYEVQNDELFLAFKQHIVYIFLCTLF